MRRERPVMLASICTTASRSFRSRRRSVNPVGIAGVSAFLSMAMSVFLSCSRQPAPYSSQSALSLCSSSISSTSGTSASSSFRACEPSRSTSSSPEALRDRQSPSLNSPLLDRANRSRSGEFNEGDWRSLKASGLELVERLGSHARKEELALVPLVDEMLDEQSDNALWDEYGAG